MKLTEFGKAKVNGIDEYGRTIVGRITEFGRIVGIVAPTAEYLAASNIGNTTARTNGKISDDGGESCEARFRWRKTDVGVQRGLISLVGITEYEVTLDTPVPVGKSFVIASCRSNRSEVDCALAEVRLTTPVNGNYTKIKATRYSDLGNCYVEWQAISGDDFTVQEGETSFSDGDETHEETINAVNLSKSFIVLSLRADFSTCEPYFNFIRSRFLSTTQIELSVYSGSTTYYPVTYWYVVEWEGATVQSGLVTVSTDVNTDSINEVNLDKALLVFNYKVWAQSFVGRALCRGRLSANNEVEFRRGVSNTSRPMYISYFAIEHPSISVQSGLEEITGYSSTSALSIAIDVSKSFMPVPIMGNGYHTTDSVQTIHYGYNTHKLWQDGNDSKVTIERCVDNDILYASWFVVKFIEQWTETEWQNSLETNDEYYEDLTELDPGTEYEFQTQAKNSAGEGEWSASAYFETVTVFLLSVTDSILAGDSRLRSMLAGLSRADGVKPGDSRSRSMIAGLSLTDGLTAGDNRLPYGMLSKLDGIKAGDTSNLLSLLSRTDGLELGSARSLLGSMLPSISDGLKVGDSGLLEALMSLTRADGLKLDDITLIEVTGIIYLYLTEGLKLGDTRLHEMLANLQLSDGTKVGDSPLIKAILLRTDGVKLGDASLLLTEAIYLSIAQGIKIGDSPSLGVLALLSLIEAIKVGDTRTMGGLGEALRMWLFSQSHLDMSVETKPHLDMSVETKSHLDMSVESREVKQ